MSMNRLVSKTIAVAPVDTTTERTTHLYVSSCAATLEGGEMDGQR